MLYKPAMVMETLGRWIYPHTHPVVRARKLRTLGYSLVIGTVASVGFAVLLWVLNRPESTDSRRLSPGLEKAVGAPPLKAPGR